MIELGKNQDLTVRRIVDFGAYLGKEEDGVDVLLPARYLPENTKVGDVINVFVYKDSEDRPIATTEKPFARVGEFAFLSVSAVNDIGAFMDWGLPKDLLVPFSEQKVKMRRGGIYPVYVFVDHATGRIVGSSKIEKFLGNVYPDYKPGQEVKALVYEHSEIGYKVIVDNLHRGMIYSNEIYSPIELEETVKAYVKQVRDDGKIDLTLNDKSVRRTENLSERLLEYLSQPGNAPVSEKMSPEMIAMIFECSKKDFKKAVGHLYKERKIVIAPDGTLAKA